MTNELQVFNFNNIPLRTTVIDNEPWFCLVDVCNVLEIKDRHQLRIRLNPRGMGLIPTPSKGGIQKTYYVNEPNLYRAILKSDKPEAQKFEDWICEEVLPQIRKTGVYGVPVLDAKMVKAALYDYFGEVMLNEEMLPKWRAMFQRWMKDVIFSEDYFEALKKLIIPWVKDAAAETLGKSIDAYIKAEMDERVKYFVEYVFKNYPKMSQKMKEYLITYGIVNYGKYSEYTRERDFRGICETIWRQEQKDPAVRYAA